MRRLDKATVRAIKTGQVITEPASAVKELVENAIDAQATSIDVQLKGGGLDRIEVSDNGSGVPPEDRPLLCQAHCTSKIGLDVGLDHVMTYGYRGEALSSLCEVGRVTFVTRTKGEVVATSLVFDSAGNTVTSEPVARTVGSTVVCCDLFKNVPVRRKRFAERKQKETKKIYDRVLAHVIIHPNIRFHLNCQPHVKMTRPIVPTIEASLVALFGRFVVEQLEYVHSAPDTQFSFEGFLPKPHCDALVSKRRDPDRIFLYINKRPVDFPKISRLITSAIRESHGTATNRYCFAVVWWNLPPEQLEYVSPDKRQIASPLIHDLEKGFGDFLSQWTPSREAPDPIVEEGDHVVPPPSLAAQEVPTPSPSSPFSSSSPSLPTSISSRSWHNDPPRRQKTTRTHRGVEEPREMRVDVLLKNLAGDACPGDGKRRRVDLEENRVSCDLSVLRDRLRNTRDYEYNPQPQQAITSFTEVRLASQDVESLSIVGSVEYEERVFFIVRGRASLFLLQHDMAHECLTFRDLLTAYHVPSVPLPVPGTLVHDPMCCNVLSSHVDTSSVLRMNGFVVKKSGSHYVLTGIPKTREVAGLEDLTELLSLITHSRVSHIPRPTVVLQHFRDESARLTRDTPHNITDADARRLLERLTGVGVTECPHGRSIFECLVPVIHPDDAVHE